MQQRKLSRRAAPGSQHPQGQGEEAGGAFAPSLKLQQLGQHLSAKQGARRSSGVALAVSGCCGDQKYGKKTEKKKLMEDKLVDKMLWSTTLMLELLGRSPAAAIPILLPGNIPPFKLSPFYPPPVISGT